MSYEDVSDFRPYRGNQFDKLTKDANGSPVIDSLGRLRREAITETDAENIMKSQLPIDEKASYADFVIDNEGTLEETEKQVKEVWEAISKTRQK